MSSLEELVPRYYADKQTEKEVKERLANDNKAIKDIMLNANKETENVGEYSVTCKVITTEDFDKTLLLNKVKSIWANQNGNMECPWVDTIEVVNDEALEDAIYNGLLNPEDLKECKVQKTQTRLTIKKGK